MTAVPPPANDRKLPGYLALGFAACFALAVGIYVLTQGGGDDDGAVAPGAFSPANTEGTPLSQLLGTTPEPGTGLLSPARPKIGEPAPDFALADIRDGRVRKLSDFRGKAVVINFFFADCAPCKREIPDFQRAQDALGDEVVFLGIDPIDSRSKAQAFLSGLNATFPALLDSGGEVNDHYRVTAGWPVTFLVDKNGVLVSQHIGQILEDELPAELAKAGVTYTLK